MVNLAQISKAPSRVCSIDASTNSLAFAIFSDKKLTSFGKIEFSGKNTFQKVGDASRKTKALFEKFDIDAIVIEHAVFMNSPKTMADLAMVQGALLGAAMETGIKTVGSINPITWQIYLGNGKLTKEEKAAIVKDNPGKSVSWYKAKERDFRKRRTINILNINYNTSVSDNDVADAIGIGHYAINNWGKIDK
jgi:Holliday junction resolvasome RuvABC endonuclease subunit